jgi:hypothetical protein
MYNRISGSRVLATGASLLLCVSGAILPGVAYACEGGGEEESSLGILSFEVSENPLKIPAGSTNSYNVLYTEIGGGSGILKQEVVKGPFKLENGSNCNKELRGGGKCKVEIKCTGVAKEKGEVQVRSPEKGVKDAKKNTECV